MNVEFEEKGGSVSSVVLGIIGLAAIFFPIIGAILTFLGILKGRRGLKSHRKGVARFGILLNTAGFFMNIITLVYIISSGNSIQINRYWFWN